MAVLWMLFYMRKSDNSDEKYVINSVKDIKSQQQLEVSKSLFFITVCGFGFPVGFCLYLHILKVSEV